MLSYAGSWPKRGTTRAKGIEKGSTTVMKFLHSKENSQQSEEVCCGMGENISKPFIWQGGLISIIYREILQLNSKMTNNLDKWAKELNIHFSKEDIEERPACTWKCSTLLILRKTQIKTTVKYYLILVTMAVRKKENKYWKDVEKLESLHIVDGNAKWYKCYGKQYGASLKN